MTVRSWASTPAVRRSMLANGPRDTRPEIALRRALGRLGIRIRSQHRIQTTTRAITADFALPQWKVAIFVDACFWHACPRHATWPKRNAAWWRSKLELNRRRDLRQRRALRQAGWGVVRMWTHESTERAADRVAQMLTRRGQ